MSCTVEQELTAYLDGELAPLQTKQVESHLHGCRSCRATEGLLRRTLSQLSTLPTFEPSAAIRRAVLAQIEREPAGPLAQIRRLLRPQLLAPSMGLVAAAALAFVWLKEHRLEPIEPGLYELAANFEVAEDYEVLGVSSLDDLEVVQHLHELEVPR